MSGTIQRTAQFRASYAAAFRSYLVDQNETALHTAYELGREAVVRELSVLDLALVHHDTLLARIRTSTDAEYLEHITRAAAHFFLESLSAFEMVKRGFREVRESALLERRHAAIVRQLSNLLADASLAADASDTLDEVLRLVAEQARELTAAECCVAVSEAGDRPIETASYPESDTGWAAFVESTDFWAMAPVEEAARGTARRGNGDRVHAWLAAPLTALDGRRLGAIHLFEKRTGDFTDVDEAVVVHLAQLTSAAVERAQLYQR